MKTIAPSLAREIMGSNFLDLGPTFFRGIDLEYVRPNSQVPFSLETLEACKDTHALVAVPGLSIRALRGLEPSKGLFHDQRLYEHDPVPPFLYNAGMASWRLLRRGPLPGSLNATREQQKALLTLSEQITNPRIVVYALLASKWATGSWLWPAEENFRLRTRAITLLAMPVYVCLVDNTIRLNSWSRGDVGPTFGVAVERIL
ncbi:MAG TPA: hypothetical protein VN495_00470 [Candidatus Paceibacterota bacterium]|nr:hypothetical protein [Candidatus Paceibacterota bacterium]